MICLISLARKLRTGYIGCGVLARVQAKDELKLRERPELHRAHLCLRIKHTRMRATPEQERAEHPKPKPSPFPITSNVTSTPPHATTAAQPTDRDT